MNVKPIKTKADYKKAMARINTLIDAPAGSPGAEQLELLSILVEAYESEHYPITPPDPVEAIRFAMEQRGLTNKDLEPMIGTRARVHEVLHRKRPLTLGMIRKLYSGLGIPAEVPIRPAL
jgi:HTH-type transcriptional regulator/antitoxin HigA